MMGLAVNDRNVINVVSALLASALFAASVAVSGAAEAKPERIFGPCAFKERRSAE